MLQNRADPWGSLYAVPDQGTLMGNRGILHNAEKKIIRQWQHNSWVTCLPEFGSLTRPKPLFSSLKDYSELFFLDEATAFAAGHRPCNFCQRERSQEFKAAWRMANASDTEFLSMDLIDQSLHKERMRRDKSKVTFDSTVGELPLGAIFTAGGQAFLVSEKGFIPWSFGGYGATQHFESSEVVPVLTPESVTRAFRQGFAPRVHVSG